MRQNNLPHFQLDYQDSNLEKQDQNLLCYHYTIVQSFNRTTRSVFDDAKILLFQHTPNFSLLFFQINSFFPILYLKKSKTRQISHPFFHSYDKTKYLCTLFFAKKNNFYFS